MSELADAIRDRLAHIKAPAPEADGGEKKNFTERLSAELTEVVARRLRVLGLPVLSPSRGRDKMFMGGYGPKGVDVYLSDEKHGLLLSSGTKGILFDVRKNLKNRYRDMVMEALELHKRFPYAVCGHLLFLCRSEVARPSKAFKTVLGEAVALMTGITGRLRPEEPAEVYETLGILVLDPGDPDFIDLRPVGVPESLYAADYCERLARMLRVRNPFYQGGVEQGEA